MSCFIDIMKIVLAAGIFMLTSESTAQENDYPELGKICPDFVLQDPNVPERTVSLSDFKGTWLIIDFWSKNCSSCIHSFPKVYQLQQEFKTEINFLMVAPGGDQEKSHRTLFEKIKNRYALNLTCYYDTDLFKKFGVEAVPHIIILNPESRVYAVTTTQYLNADNLRKMIRGDSVHVEHKRNAFEETLADNKPGRDVLSEPIVKKPQNRHESIMRIRDNEPIRIVLQIDRDINNAHYNTTATSLKRLYTIAYFGKSEWNFQDSLYSRVWPQPILEINDSLRAGYFKSGAETYNYSLTVPPVWATREYMQWAMQCDLKKYFGFEVTVETRSMPIWKLTARPSARKNLRTKGGASHSKIDYGGFTFVNHPLTDVLPMIDAHADARLPVIDATGISGNIDITIQAILTEFDDIRKALKQQGLILVKDEKKMNVLVIRDAPPPFSKGLRKNFPDGKTKAPIGAF